MTTDLDARSLLESLVGQRISTLSVDTLTGRPSIVLGLADINAIVGTDRSPDGEPVPIGAVQVGLMTSSFTTKRASTQSPAGHERLARWQRPRPCGSPIVARHGGGNSKSVHSQDGGSTWTARSRLIRH
jgi:hypothetical protein